MDILVMHNFGTKISKKLIQRGKSVLVWVEIKFLVEMPDFIRK